MSSEPRQHHQLRLQAELWRAWSRQLHHWCDQYNRDYLASALRKPNIVIGQSTCQFGSWNPRTRTITISAMHMERDSWFSVLDTLRHEMAHQYVDECAQPVGEGPHGSCFQEACRRLRCDGRAHAGPDAPAQQAGAPEDRMMRKLRKVLSLADSPMEHEALVAMQKAQLLLLKYNLDIVALDQQRHYSQRCLSDIKARRLSYEYTLASILTGFFFVEVLWNRSYDAKRNKSGSVLEIYGTAENLNMAEYVYHYLVGLLPGMWQAYAARSGINHNRHRQRYFAGVLDGLYRKLAEQQERLKTDHALVWRGDTQLRRYYAHINPRTTCVSIRGASRTAAFWDGSEDGKQITIHRPIASRGNGLRGLLTAQ